MQEISNSARLSLERLCQLLGITINNEWQKNLAEKIGFQNRNLFAVWISRGDISKDGVDKLEELTCPRSQWYVDKSENVKQEITPIIQDKSGLWGKTREVSANGKVVKLTLYEAEKQHDEPQVAISTDLAPLVYRLEKALVGQKEDIAMLIKVLDKADDAEIMRSVARILTSGETSTAMALKMNVMEFGEKIEKEKQLKGTIYGMEQQIIATNAEVAKLKAELSKEKKGPPGLREPVDPAQHE
jgi:hypothetical protein